jgi:hypothetical protein
MELSAKLNKDLDDAAVMVASVNWTNMTIDGQGACIPISFALNEFMVLRGRPSRVAETTLVGRDSMNMRWFQIEPSENGLLGHCVTLLPAAGLLLDGSLWTQPSKVLANFDIPRLFIMPWNRELGSSGKMDRLTLRYKPDLKAKEWKNRNWPWAEIRDVVQQIDHDLKELE